MRFTFFVASRLQHRELVILNECLLNIEGVERKLERLYKWDFLMEALQKRGEIALINWNTPDGVVQGGSFYKDFRDRTLFANVLLCQL